MCMLTKLAACICCSCFASQSQIRAAPCFLMLHVLQESGACCQAGRASVAEKATGRKSERTCLMSEPEYFWVQWGTKEPVYLALVRKQAESRTGGFDEVLADFPTLPRRKQAVTAGHQEAPGHLLGEPWSSEEGRGYTVIPSPINILAFSERAAPQVPQWCSNAEEKGSVGMFCTFFRIWRPRPEFSWIPVTYFGSVTVQAPHFLQYLNVFFLNIKLKTTPIKTSALMSWRRVHLHSTVHCWTWAYALPWHYLTACFFFPDTFPLQ